MYKEIHPINKKRKNIHSSNSGKGQLNLISADAWEKHYYKLLVEDRKEF